MPNCYKTSERALLALRHRLYVPAWRMKESLKDAATNPELYVIQIAYEGTVPVGVIVAQHARYNRCVNGKEPEARYRRLSRNKAISLQLFVKKPHRRFGHGSRLLMAVKVALPDRQYRAGKGVSGSDEFWRRNHVMPWHCKDHLDSAKWIYH
jgi:GNAT superfamily N-acetyltransferase